MKETPLVVAVIRHRGSVLLTRRSRLVCGDEPNSPDDVDGEGRLDLPGAPAEADPETTLWDVIEVQTGLESEACDLVRRGGEFALLGAEWRGAPRGDKTERSSPVIVPYLVECSARSSSLEPGLEWVQPTALLLADRDAPPGRWPVYERVAPTVRSLTADDEHGAAWLSLRALEILRDRAAVVVDERDGDGDGGRGGDRDENGDGSRAQENGVADAQSTVDVREEWRELSSLATRLLEARPSMAVVRNRLNRALGEAVRAANPGRRALEVLQAESETAADTNGRYQDDEAIRAPDGARVHRTAKDTLERAERADERTAERASDLLCGTVMTHSRSATVVDALSRSDVDRVYVTESRPGREGIDVAESLAADRPVTALPDAAGAALLASGDVDGLVVGADTITGDGGVINKVGTRGFALVAHREGVPVTVVAAADKITSDTGVSIESGLQSAVYDGAAAIDVCNPIFDRTPPEAVTEMVTETEVLEPAAVGDLAAERERDSAWQRL